MTLIYVAYEQRSNDTYSVKIIVKNTLQVLKKLYNITQVKQNVLNLLAC